MCSELKGIRMCTVIGAEAGLMQWITRILPAQNTHTHTHKRMQAKTPSNRRGGESTSERSVLWWPWIFLSVVGNCTPPEEESGTHAVKHNNVSLQIREQIHAAWIVGEKASHTHTVFFFHPLSIVNLSKASSFTYFHFSFCAHLIVCYS